MPDEPAFGPDDFEILADETVYDGFWSLALLRVRHRRHEGGWSLPMQRELHRRGNAVGVLLYDPVLDRIGVVEQFRVGALTDPAGPWMLELVAGLLEQGESPEQVAHREALEEAGCEITALEPIASYYSSPGGCDEYFHLYCAQVDLLEVDDLHGLDHEHEDIRLHVVPWERVADLRASGRFKDAHSLLAIEWLAAHRARLRDKWRG